MYIRQNGLETMHFAKANMIKQNTMNETFVGENPSLCQTIQ